MQANASEGISFLTEDIRKRSIRQGAFRMNEVLRESRERWGGEAGWAKAPRWDFPISGQEWEKLGLQCQCQGLYWIWWVAENFLSKDVTGISQDRFMGHLQVCEMSFRGEEGGHRVETVVYKGVTAGLTTRYLTRKNTDSKRLQGSHG